MNHQGNHVDPPNAFRFLSKRLLAMTGYSVNPMTFDAMLFYLPPFSSITSRVVRVQDKMWELWTPNSACHAFYPGLSDGETVLGTELPPTSRQSDGHLGRFDYSLNAQHFDKWRPWLGFMKKKQFDSSLENVSLTEVWEPLTPPNFGRFQSSFIGLASLRFSLPDWHENSG